jgi:putative flippase GtrA
MERHFSFADRAELRRFALFLIVGLVNTAFGYGVFALLILLGAGASAAAIGSTLLGVLFNFRSTGRAVFGSRDTHLLPRFLAVYGLQCTANVLALRAFASLGVGSLLAQALILPPLAVASFLLMRRFVFSAAPCVGVSP